MSIVWDRAAEFITDNLTALTPIVLLAIFVPLTLMGSLMPLMGDAGPAGNLTLGIVVLILSCVTAWGGLAITALAFDPAEGRGAAIATANRRFPALLGISVAMLLIVLLLIAPVGVAFGLSGVDMAVLASGNVPESGVNGAALAFAVLWLLMLAPLMLFVYARFFVLVTPIVVMERRGLGAFARSFVLTRGVAWKVIGMLLLYLIVSTVAGMAAKTVFGSVLRLLLGDDGQISLAGVLTQIVVSGISTAFSVLAIAFIAKLYLAARDARAAIVEGA